MHGSVSVFLKKFYVLTCDRYGKYNAQADIFRLFLKKENDIKSVYVRHKFRRYEP